MRRKSNPPKNTASRKKAKPPETVPAAISFFREQCDAQLRNDPDHDKLRVKIHGRDNTGAKINWAILTELSIYDEQERNSELIRIAQSTFAVWQGLQPWSGEVEGDDDDF